MAENQTTALPRRLQSRPLDALRVSRVRLSTSNSRWPLPDIYNALTVELANTGVHEEGETTKKITLEVEQHLAIPPCVPSL